METTVKGRVWKICDAGGRLIDDIDTDQIFHNAHLAITDIGKMGAHAFGNLEGWKDFPSKAKPGDILMVGGNFGAGSSRQHAVDCFASLGTGLIIAESYGAIYERNAINSGFPILACPGVKELAIKNGDSIEVDLRTGKMRNMTEGRDLGQARPFSGVQMDIYRAGNLFDYARGM
ncbi:MAG: 3-isopropylmalate dehydratase [Candidatus Eremiobacteraeota bacterium]|nr:3-isopropylmalate dehydratase [Candidatus Eremiobacteraeota bacterium]